MFLFWLAVTLIIGFVEYVSDSYKAYKYHQEHPYDPNEKWWNRK